MSFTFVLELIQGMRQDRRAVAKIGLSGTGLTENMVRRITARILGLPDKQKRRKREVLELQKVSRNSLVFSRLLQRLIPLLQNIISRPVLLELRAACDYREVELRLSPDAYLGMGPFHTAPR